MLSYLNMLCVALLARESLEIRRLLKHPLARVLPRRVREEAYAIARLGTSTRRAPIHTLTFYHQTVQLLGAHAEPESMEISSPTEPWVDEVAPHQLELPLRALAGA